jgi:hypothetical protein
MLSNQPSMRRKKWLLLGLLGASNVIAGFLLWQQSNHQTYVLHELSQVDTIIRNEFTAFNLRNEEVKTIPASTEDGLVRAIYRVTVPQDFSNTFFHSELALKLYPYEIRVPATVELPGTDMNIHVYVKNTVVRTIQLRRSDTLNRPAEPGFLLVEARSDPSAELLQLLATMGEPIRLIIRSDNPEVLLEWLQDIPNTTKPPLFYLDAGESISLLSAKAFDRWVGMVATLAKIKPNASVIVRDDAISSSPERLERLKKTGVNIVPLVDPTYVLKDMEREAFRSALAQFVQRTRNGEKPYLVLEADSQLLQWLKEELIPFKKGGLALEEPELLQRDSIGVKSGTKP